jgi:hypothetical protein
VARVNQMRPFVQPRLCEAVGGSSFDLMLAYADGSRVLLKGTVAGNCAHMEAPNGSSWTGSQQILNEALALIYQHRRLEDPSQHPAPPRCPEQWQDVFTTTNVAPLRPGAPAGVTACRYRLRLNPQHIDQSANGSQLDQVVVTKPVSLLSRIRAGGTADPCQGRDYRLDPTQELLLIRNVWGDINVVTANAPCWPNTLTGERRYPSQALADEVASLF